MLGIDLLSPRALFLTVVATAMIFVLVVFIARATVRRAVGSLVAAVPLVPLVMMIDAVAARLGWWRYPSIPTGSAPVAWYIAAALAYGAAVGLVGWRVLRRFGVKSLATFVMVVAAVGVSRDFAYSISTGLIKFGGGVIPLAADFLAYGVGAALVQLLMMWIVGTPSSDRLARGR